MPKKVVVVKKKKASVAVTRKATNQGAEVFSTEPLNVEVPKTQVLLLINGRDKGLVTFGNQNLGQFVMAQAQSQGIRNFSVYIDDQKGDTSMSGKSLATVQKIEIVSKDARGV